MSVVYLASLGYMHAVLRVQVKSWHYSIWLSVISCCVGDSTSIIVSTPQRSLFHNNVARLQSVLQLCWQSSPLTEASVQQLALAIDAWRAHQEEHFGRFSRSNNKHENFHKLCHAPAQVERNGGLSTTCTGSYEKSHGVTAKKPAKQHNHKGVPERRMLRVVRRAELLKQRELGSGEEYTKAVYKTMRGDDKSYNGSSTATSQVCGYGVCVREILPQLFRVEALTWFKTVLSSTTTLGNDR